jgi:hypothetical protein
MSAIFKKLNYKDQAEIWLLNAPESFAPEVEALLATAVHPITIQHTITDASQITFSLAFVTKQEQVDTLAAEINARADGDVIVWFAYPKGTSKQYTCEFNRDTGWASLGTLGYEPVRQIAIDADWSALRFRRVAYIKSMTRNAKMALSAEGKKRAEE